MIETLSLSSENIRALDLAHLIKDITGYYCDRFLQHDRATAKVMNGWSESAVAWLGSRCEFAPHQWRAIIRRTKMVRRRLRWVRGDFIQQLRGQRKLFIYCDENPNTDFFASEGWTFEEVIEWMEERSRLDEAENWSPMYAMWAQYGEPTSPFEAVVIINVALAFLELADRILERQSDPRVWQS